MNIGNNIKSLRLKSGLTQEQLANMLGISFQAISKWETNANTPDIGQLPQIAKIFQVTIDALFFDAPTAIFLDSDIIKDDDVIRIVQLKGKNILKVDRTFSADNPPIEIAFPRNCNDSTQYFRIEVFGHIIADASINGDVVCHGSVNCANINGSLRCDGDVKAGTISSHADIKCHNIVQCYDLHCANIECEQVSASNLTCQQMIRKA